MICCDVFSSSSVVPHVFSALCVHQNSGISLIPWTIFAPNFVSFVASVAELAHGGKSCTQSRNQSFTHPTYMMGRELKLSLRKNYSFYVLPLLDVFCCGLSDDFSIKHSGDDDNDYKQSSTSRSYNSNDQKLCTSALNMRGFPPQKATHDGSAYRELTGTRKDIRPCYVTHLSH